MRYAQINPDNICFADSFLSGEVTADNLILLAESDPSPIGKMWNGSTWEDVPEPEPEPVRNITRLAFRNRFTTSEKVAIYTAAESNVLLRVFLDDLANSQEVDLDFPGTIEGVMALEHFGIIAEGRAAEILS